MPTFGDILNEIQDEERDRQRSSAVDNIRRKHIRRLADLTGRNVVVYYSGWLQRPDPQYHAVTQINDEDKHGFMACFAGIDFSRGLDLVLHTPGGDVAATESIIDYIHSKFGSNVRAIVPQISMSGGTMMAISARQILMGRHSNLGPIDPQLGGRPAISLLQEFAKAKADILAAPQLAMLWQPILQHYGPTLLSYAEQSIAWAREIAGKSMREGMFHGDPEVDAKTQRVMDFLLSQDLHKAHGRHLHRGELRNAGLPIADLEDDPNLQDAVLSVHHACMLTVGNHNAIKLIENQNGITHAKLVGVPVAMPFPIQFAQPGGPANDADPATIAMVDTTPPIEDEAVAAAEKAD